jgi:hypothetical protein
LFFVSKKGTRVWIYPYNSSFAFLSSFSVYRHNTHLKKNANFSRPGANDFSKLVYSNTPMRAVTYLCGMVLGYGLSSGKKQPLLQPWTVALGWVSSAGLCCSVLFTVAITYQEAFVYDPLQAAFYAGLHRLAWSLGLAWVVWACVHGYAGAVYIVKIFPVAIFCTLINQ